MTPTKKQRERWSKIASLGCIICASPDEIHHCFTGAGGRKNHDKVIPLCPEHHRGKNGIDGRHLSKRQWQDIYGSEQELLDRINRLVD